MSEPKDDLSKSGAESEAAGVMPSPDVVADEPSPDVVADEPSPDVRADASLDARPKKRRRKKRRADAAPESPVDERPALDASGRERAQFLLKFPRDPGLDELVSAFERGNYASVRELGPSLMERSERPDVQAAARELVRRIEPDPVVKFLLFAALSLFVAVVAYVYYAHG